MAVGIGRIDTSSTSGRGGFGACSGCFPSGLILKAIALWLIVPPGFILVLAALLRRGEIEHRAPAFMTAVIRGATPAKAEIRYWQALSDNSGFENRLSTPDTSGHSIADRGGNRGVLSTALQIRGTIPAKLSLPLAMRASGQTGGDTAVLEMLCRALTMAA